jgi:hypothetical protein
LTDAVERGDSKKPSLPTHALQQTYYNENNGTKPDNGEEQDHDTKYCVQDVKKVLVVIVVVDHALFSSLAIV